MTSEPSVHFEECACVAEELVAAGAAQPVYDGTELTMVVVTEPELAEVIREKHRALHASEGLH